MLKPPGSITPVRPRRLSSRKNLRVPSTCSAKFGVGQAREQRGDGGTRHRAGGLAVGIALQLRPAGQVGVRLDLQRVQRGLRQHRPGVEPLHVDRMAGRRGGELGLRRPALLLELLLGPAAGDDQPAAGPARVARLAHAAERFLQRRGADPVHLGGEAERGADRVHVRIDQARDHRAALQVDHAGRLARQLADFRIGSDRENAVAVGPQAPRAPRTRSSPASTLPLTSTVSAGCANAVPAKRKQTRTLSALIRP